jgi:peptidylprolyl isomerase/FKBP-type peptidyl-prolyl cis-trans isomerase FklB
MRYGWVRAVAIAALLATAACQKAEAPAPDVAAAENEKAGADFLARNAKAEGVVSLPSGVQYKVVQSGPPGGESPDNNDLVRVEYVGTLLDGTVFDSSYQRGQPAVFGLDAVVPGWTDALQHMRVGDEWYIYIPGKLGYGEQSSGEIPPNSVLTFRVKLLDIARTPGGGKAIATAMG